MPKFDFQGTPEQAACVKLIFDHEREIVAIVTELQRLGDRVEDYAIVVLELGGGELARRLFEGSAKGQDAKNAADGSRHVIACRRDELAEWFAPLTDKSAPIARGLQPGQVMAIGVRANTVQGFTMTLPPIGPRGDA